MSLVTWSLTPSPAPIPRKFEFAPFRSVIRDPVKALSRILSKFQPFAGRVTISCSGPEQTRVYHLKFSSPTNVTIIPNRDLDQTTYEEVKKVWTRASGEINPTQSKRQLLDLLDESLPKQPEEDLIFSYLVSSIIDQHTDLEHSRLENEKAERRLASLEAKTKLLEARLSWLTGELVHLKSESFLASTAPAPPAPPAEPGLPDWTWL